MLVRQGLLFVCFLLIYTGRSFSQGVPNPTDTSYVMTLLKKAEAIEMQQPETALRNYRKALSFSSKIGYTKGYFESIRLITYLLDILGHHDESYKLATEGLQKAMRDTSEQYRSLCHFAIAQSVKWQGKNKEAILHFKQAAPFMLGHKNRRKAAVLYQNLGLMYESEKLYPQALLYFDRALTNDRLAKSSDQDISLDYQSMAAIYVKQNQLKRGLAYYQKAKALLDPGRDRHIVASLYGNLANLHKELVHFDSSLYYYQEALRMNRQLNNPLQELHLLAGLAETYNELKQYKQAKSLLDKAYALAKQHKVGLSEFRNIYREYANANLGLGRYKDAIPWYDQYMQTKDSLSTLEAKTLLEDYELKLRQAEAGQKLAEKQRQISRLEQARQRQNLWLLIASLVGVVIVSGLVFAYLYTRQRQRTADNALLAAEHEHALAVVQSELQGQQKERLRIAKEMHDDLGASLTAIGLLSEVAKTRMGTAIIPEVEKISTISADMVASMNEIIWSLNSKNDSLNGLIAYTRAYASEFIDNTSLSLKTEVNESPKEITIRGADRRNVFLTVKEALNNVVKHAQATQVALRIRPETDRLLIEVSDNGRGFTPTEQTRLRNGLANMQNRMAEAGGTFTILPSSTGTQVKIMYPYPLVSDPKILQT
ncbi:tetratricopeptide repeat-containing sensor histidine kinase [Spirosoma radiotolerans]|uniref:tetratricopeptide repeat-containing sensor histidine kinase n=1 Tax=Spirosoma radiotolerans TaxID=1379870 RepID=UPI000697275B|nr:tetratricopeptide repeat protein [Spirosoma radiotolerans]